MPELPDAIELQRQWEALQDEHPELEPVAALVLLALKESGPAREAGISTALISRRLGLEHALIRRAAADLETGGWVSARPAGASSPALRLILTPTC
ncbi:MarR family transcriptional regulator [Salinicola halimionae]|uniref:MarR family transcriptional regulator n=1 Tax=Salinicola halimionae TaxID=1949081 RepID=UPI000DA21291|nr:helix-turn-helix domain-containing protein [Salinicola halimionae]